MKKEYESPKATKLEFNYVDTVVASGTSASSETGDLVQVWVGDDHFPSSTNCAKQWSRRC